MNLIVRRIIDNRFYLLAQDNWSKDSGGDMK